MMADIQEKYSKEDFENFCNADENWEYQHMAGNKSPKPDVQTVYDEAKGQVIEGSFSISGTPKIPYDQD